MSITIQECGHSAETSSRAYVKDPDTCVSCAWIAKHGPAKSPYDQRGATEYRAKQADNARKAWKARKASEALKSQNNPSTTSPKMAEEN